MTAGEVRKVIDSHRRRRPLRVLAYALLCLGGLVLMADPTQSMQAAGQEIRWVWSGLIVLGSVGTLYGSWKDRYMVEFVGLPLLGVSFVAFVVVLGARHTTGTLAFGCFLASLVVIMISRWLDLWQLVGVSTRVERKRR